MAKFLLYLLSLQFAMGRSDFMCIYIETLRCYMPVTKENDPPGYCTSYESVLSCLQEQAVRCHVDNTTEVRDMLKTVEDVCTEGTELNTEYQKHASCYLESLQTETKAKCLREFREATVREVQSLRGVYLEEFKNSEDARAELIGQLSCGYMWGILQCSKDTLEQTCGHEAMTFFAKVKSPKEHFMRLACANQDEDNDNHQPVVTTKAPAKKNAAPEFLASTLLVLVAAMFALKL